MTLPKWRCVRDGGGSYCVLSLTLPSCSTPVGGRRDGCLGELIADDHHESPSLPPIAVVFVFVVRHNCRLYTVCRI